MKKHTHAKSYYNDIALRVGQKLLGLEHLHYGYFGKRLKPELKNLTEAQEAYAKNLLSFIPKKGIKKIFDVGCGTGGMATHLVNKGYKLTCLAPDPFLTAKTSENTGGKVSTITDLYENVDDIVDGTFDMVLMSESAQYIKIDEGWTQNNRFVRPGGYVLIADFFRVRELDRPNLSKSGHPLDHYIKVAEESGFELLKQTDITPEVAPTMDIYQELINEKVFPVIEAIFEFVERRYPIAYKVLRRLLGKEVARLKEKYSNQDAETFRTYKAYMVLLFKKKES